MENVAKDRKKFDVAVVGKILIYLTAFHFLFFGYICNVYDKTPGDHLLFVYTSMFSASSYLTFITFIVINLIMSFTEDFLIIAVKKALWVVPFIVASSILWFMWNYLTLPTNEMGFFDPLIDYFSSYKGYLNILILLVVSVSSAILGAFLKIKYREQFKKRSAEEQ